MTGFPPQPETVETAKGRVEYESPARAPGSFILMVEAGWLTTGVRENLVANSATHAPASYLAPSLAAVSVWVIEYILNDFGVGWSGGRRGRNC